VPIIVRLTQALGPMETELSKFAAATNQLNWAIDLYFDHQAYIPAITLAGAAEEILGEPLGNNSIFSVLRDNLSAEFHLATPVVSQQHLNKAKNWLKHWKGLRDEESIAIDLRIEATQYLVRATANFLDHDIPPSPQITRFVEWAALQRSQAGQS